MALYLNNMQGMRLHIGDSGNGDRLEKRSGA